MLRPGQLVAVLEALQIIPAALGGDRSPQARGHPIGDVTRSPALGSVGRRAGQRRPQLLLLLSRQHARCPPGGRAPPVDHAGWPLLVVAFGNLADPAAVIPGGVGNRRGGLAPRQQPEDLPPRPLLRLVGCSVPLFEVRDAQMRRQIYICLPMPRFYEHRQGNGMPHSMWW
jgi:hypothetical protein